MALIFPSRDPNRFIEAPNIIAQSGIRIVVAQLQSNVSREIARYLRGLGVQRAYGLPGGEVTHIIDAIVAAGIEWVLVHHEAAGAHMADAESQLTGRPAVCVSTVGPGATNLVNGVANSFLERSPVIALVGEFDAAERAATVHMNVDLRALFDPISAYVERVDAGNLATVLAHTENALRAPVPGPVTLLISARDQRSPVDQLQLPGPVSAATPESGAGELGRQLRNANRASLVLGVGARENGLIDAVRTLAAAHDLPVVITPKAKGWMPSDDPRFGGVLASYGSSGAEHLLAESDLIVAVGLDGTDLIRPWRFGAPLRLGVAGRYDQSVPGPQLICDPLLTLSELCEVELPSFDGLERAANARAAAEGARTTGTLAARALPEHMLGGLDPVDALRAIRRGTPREAIATCDVGMFKLALCQYWDSYQPASFLVSNGLSTMAYGLPAASAAALARPGYPVVALLGDGGLLMGAGELETLSRLDLPVTVLVAVDSSLALIRLKAEVDGLIEQPNDFRPVDYVALARSMGLRGRRAEDLDQLQVAVADGIAGNRPNLIEFPVDYSAYRNMGG